MHHSHAVLLRCLNWEGRAGARTAAAKGICSCVACVHQWRLVKGGLLSRQVRSGSRARGRGREGSLARSGGCRRAGSSRGVERMGRGGAGLGAGGGAGQGRRAQATEAGGQGWGQGRAPVDKSQDREKIWKSNSGECSEGGRAVSCSACMDVLPVYSTAHIMQHFTELLRRAVLE